MKRCRTFFAWYMSVHIILLVLLTIGRSLNSNMDSFVLSQDPLHSSRIRCFSWKSSGLTLCQAKTGTPTSYSTSTKSYQSCSEVRGFHVVLRYIARKSVHSIFSFFDTRTQDGILKHFLAWYFTIPMAACLTTRHININDLDMKLKWLKTNYLTEWLIERFFSFTFEAFSTSMQVILY